MLFYWDIFFQNLSDDMKNFKNSLFCAIDFRNPGDAHKLIYKVKNYIDGIKVGLEFFVANGPDSVTELKRYNLPIFLDLKLHDIPNTVYKSVNSVLKIKPEILSVHISGGKRMLRKISNIKHRPKIVGVSMLTSLDKDDLKEIGIRLNPRNFVKRLTKIALESKLEGIVCSALEAKIIKPMCPTKFLIITPGIRFGNEEMADQKRVSTPKQAIKNGASIIVVGRSITSSKDPENMAKLIKKTIE